MQEIIIEKSLTEQIRISVSEFKNKKYINIRTYFKPFDKQDADWSPTKKGITLPIEKYEELKSAVAELEKSL